MGDTKTGSHITPFPSPCWGEEKGAEKKFRFTLANPLLPRRRYNGHFLMFCYHVANVPAPAVIDGNVVGA